MPLLELKTFVFFSSSIFLTSQQLYTKWHLTRRNETAHIRKRHLFLLYCKLWYSSSRVYYCEMNFSPRGNDPAFRPRAPFQFPNKNQDIQTTASRRSALRTKEPPPPPLITYSTSLENLQENKIEKKKLLSTQP